MDPNRRLILGLVFFFLLFMIFCTAQRQPTIESTRFELTESFKNNKSESDLDLRNFKESLVNPDVSTPKSPCLNNKKYAKLGYDNPYIFPYNNSMNLNYPTSRYRSPQWCRQLKLEEIGYRGFPGYYY